MSNVIGVFEIWFYLFNFDGLFMMVVLSIDVMNVEILFGLLMVLVGMSMIYMLFEVFYLIDMEFDLFNS